MPKRKSQFTRTWAKYLGFLTALPLVLSIYVFILLLGTPGWRLEFEGLGDPKFWILATPVLVGFLLSAWAFLYYIYILMTKNLPLNNQEHIWLFVFIVGGHAGMLAFWYTYIWKPSSTIGNDEKLEGEN